MSYDRRIDLSVSGVNLTPTGLAAQGLRVRFNIQSHTVSSPNACQIIVTNLDDKTATQLLNEYGPVTLSVGYVDGKYGQIFKGTVTQVITGERERGTDKLTRIYCYDGDAAHSFATVSTSLAAGWTPQNVLDTLMKSLTSYGINPSPTVLGLDLSKPKGIRGIVLSGSVTDHMRDLASSLGATWSVQQGQGILAAKGAGLSTGAVRISETIGYPRQTSDGIYITTLIDPTIAVLGQIQLNQSTIVRSVQDTNPLSKTSATNNALLDTQGIGDGTYTVLHQEIEADTRGNEWYQFHTCIGSNTGVLSRSQADYLGPS